MKETEELERELTFKTIYYGELVDVQTETGKSCGCKVHAFNRKGVFVGREYIFTPYSDIKRHPKGLTWEQKFIKWGYGKRPGKRTWRQVVFEVACRITTFLMRWTQAQFHIDIIKSGKFQKI